ncbi:cupin domain-containing protein [Rhodohalobacter sp. SW132]|uniref:cupin domain-containing protein n=1 Tax=Rhodohalobacter sp. SW132 TaxID=2293433 RepID=UPI000E22F0AB|nr:cupin domain-containing protein [Rhodohalobacter sp. SW132]REL33081.1 cupin domain-containing protein [Rhodohalobacter sp. SW132]
MSKSKSAVLSCDNFSWDGVEKKIYKTETDNFRDIHRYTLLGDEHSELNSETRYFEIQPDGYSSLEYHRHPHSVVIIRGSGSVILNDELHSIQSFDVVYIGPETIHQFHADNGEELGFICVVDRYRDRPSIPDDDQIRNTIRSEKILKKIRK